MFILFSPDHGAYLRSYDLSGPRVVGAESEFITNRNVKVESKTKYVLFLRAINGYLRQNKALIDGTSIICHNEHNFHFFFFFREKHCYHNLHRVWLVLQH